MHHTLTALIEQQETQQRHRGSVLDSFVSVRDLLKLGLITEEQLVRLTDPDPELGLGRTG
jgi:hypothetical protein